MHFLAEYGIFLAKIITFVIAALVLFAGIIAIASKDKGKAKEKIKVKKLNKKYAEMADKLSQETRSKYIYKKLRKAKKLVEKKREKANTAKRIFVIEFIGDIKASAVQTLREEITAILTVATAKDEVLALLESGGGMVHAYGLAASQLSRIKEKGIPLTIAIDKVAASGGYLMACVANKILAAPFAIIGSIGVIAQIPNFHKLLKQKNIDFEQITAGEYKRTLTLFGENTEKARQKFKEEIEQIHNLFKEYILQHRSQVNINEVATGEHWLAKRAHELKLVDELVTSDDYLLNASQDCDLYKVSYYRKKTMAEKISKSMQAGLEFMSLRHIQEQNNIDRWIY